MFKILSFIIANFAFRHWHNHHHRPVVVVNPALRERLHHRHHHKPWTQHHPVGVNLTLAGEVRSPRHEHNGIILPLLGAGTVGLALGSMMGSLLAKKNSAYEEEDDDDDYDYDEEEEDDDTEEAVFID